MKDNLNLITIFICALTTGLLLYSLYKGDCNTVKIDYIDTTIEPNVHVEKYEKHCVIESK